jgi:hypothetical protein
MLFYFLLFAFIFSDLCIIRMLYAQPRARTRRAARLVRIDRAGGQGLLKGRPTEERTHARSHSAVHSNPPSSRYPLRNQVISELYRLSLSIVVCHKHRQSVGTSAGLNMATLHKLTDLACQRAKAGKHGDGGRLTLVVQASGAKSWLVLSAKGPAAPRDGAWPVPVRRPHGSAGIGR